MRIFYRSVKRDPGADDVILARVPYGTKSVRISEGGREFQEIFMPFAFSDSVRQGQGKIYFLYNHNRGLPLGFLGENAEIREDRTGLKIRLQIPPGEFGTVILESAAAGELGVSPGMNILEDSWPKADLRHVIDAELIEVSLTKLPAYGLVAASACMNKPATDKRMREQPPPPVRFIKGGALAYTLESRGKIIRFNEPKKEV